MAAELPGLTHLVAESCNILQ